LRVIRRQLERTRLAHVSAFEDDGEPFHAQRHTHRVRPSLLVHRTHVAVSSRPSSGCPGTSSGTSDGSDAPRFQRSSRFTGHAALANSGSAFAGSR
jgi:hypothetical protein